MPYDTVTRDPSMPVRCWSPCEPDEEQDAVAALQSEILRQDLEIEQTNRLVAWLLAERQAYLARSPRGL